MPGYRATGARCPWGRHRGRIPIMDWVAFAYENESTRLGVKARMGCVPEDTMRMTRLVAVGLLVLAVAASAADMVVVEDWSKYPVGTKGVPPGWKGQNWGNPSYEFEVVEDEGRRALHMTSRDESSTIAKDVRRTVDLKETPVLEWSWKAVTLPKGGNSCKKATDDQAGQVFVAWERFPSVVRSRIIGYVWDTTVPVGTICKSENTGTVTYVVLRSGPTEAGKWLTEHRNVREDFKKIYGEDPGNPDGVSLSIDANDTHSVAEAYIGTIGF